MKYYYLLLMSALLSACSLSNDAQLNCLSADTHKWSLLRQQCLPLSEMIKISDSEHEGRFVYVLLAEDFQHAEVFFVEPQERLLFQAVKGGYRSIDGHYYLQRQSGYWRLRQPLP